MSKVARHDGSATAERGNSAGASSSAESPAESTEDQADNWLADGGIHGSHHRLQDEIGQLKPTVRWAQGLTNLLPQFCFNRVRTTLWRSAGIPIGEGSLIMGELFLSGSGDWPALLSIGKHTYISGPLRMNLGAPVRIGDNVNIGQDCLFLTVDHEAGPPWRRAGWSRPKPVVIEDGAWITSRVTILPGVTIGAGAIVATGAVVAKSVPAHTMVGGVPAKVIRPLPRSADEP